MRPTAVLLLVSLLASAVAQGQPPPAAEATSASHAAMPDVGKGAEEVAAQLRQLTESLLDTAAFASLEAEVAADTHGAAERWNETGDLLKTNLRPAALDSLETYVRIPTPDGLPVTCSGQTESHGVGGSTPSLATRHFSHWHGQLLALRC